MIIKLIEKYIFKHFSNMIYEIKHIICKIEIELESLTKQINNISSLPKTVNNLNKSVDILQQITLDALSRVALSESTNKGLERDIITTNERITIVDTINLELLEDKLEQIQQTQTHCLSVFTELSIRLTNLENEKQRARLEELTDDNFLKVDNDIKELEKEIESKINEMQEAAIKSTQVSIELTIRLSKIEQDIKQVFTYCEGYTGALREMTNHIIELDGIFTTRITKTESKISDIEVSIIDIEQKLEHQEIEQASPDSISSLKQEIQKLSGRIDMLKSIIGMNQQENISTKHIDK